MDDLGLGPRNFLSKEETLELAPTLEGRDYAAACFTGTDNLMMQGLRLTWHKQRPTMAARLLNYCKVTDLIKTDNKITGVHAHNIFSGKNYEIKSKALINATGVFTDSILKMDHANSEEIIAPSQGVHIVLDKEFLPGEAAIMVPHTDDGRVLFAVPWHNKIIIGTTDTPVYTQDLNHWNPLRWKKRSILY